MNSMIKFLLDSGDPKEYREIAKLAKEHSSEIWGATTNPTLIAKTLKDRKLTQQEAFDLQKEIEQFIGVGNFFCCQNFTNSYFYFFEFLKSYRIHNLCLNPFSVILLY